MKLTIFDIDNWREIGATLAQNKTRTFMTGFGIFWGTAIRALPIGGAEGLKHFMSRNFEGFATNASVI
ncbi:MAG: ABC transporter permease, partial [Duncaniella sp.]|nr:ABC transporter permease [Duncaniella sp.]